MKKQLNLLIVEDTEDDVFLVLRQIKKLDYEIIHQSVSTIAELKKALESRKWDLVISDYNLPGFTGKEVLALFKEAGNDIPFILVSGIVGEDIAVEMMKAGANDYIMKGNLQRLGPAVERELRETRIKKLLHNMQLQTIRKEERERIAREIHDELGQLLTAIKLNMTILKKYTKPADERSVSKTEGIFADIFKFIDNSIRAVRTIANELRPEILLEHGLREALEMHLRDFQKITGTKCHFRSNIEKLIIDTERSSAVFRIFQESLTNIARHSQATQIDIKFDIDDKWLFLKIRDNGVGFDESRKNNAKSFGLTGMRERTALLGGDFKITGIKNKGTKVDVRIPVER